MPRSSPSAVGGYHGSVSLDSGLLIADCQLPIADFKTRARWERFAIENRKTNRKSAIGNRQCSYHSLYGLPSDETSVEAL
jgi:hypothetical protein